MRVFISHGLDKAEPGQSQYLDDLAAALAAPTPAGTEHEVLVDRTRLAAGDDWNGVLLDCLDECDRAVLLLTERALTRPWVWREATILDFRHRRRDGFRLYPVALGDSVRERLPGVPALAALRLDDIQWMPAGATAAQVAAHVHAQLDALPQPGANPLVETAEAIAAHLAGASTDGLEELLKLLEVPLAFDAGTKMHRRCALGLARAILGGRLGEIGLPGILTRLSSQCAVGEEAIERILALASPLWVASETASLMARHCRDLNDGGAEEAVALYAGSFREYCGRMIAHRQLVPAVPRPGKNVLLPLPGGGSPLGFKALEAEMVRALCEKRKMPDPNARAMLKSGAETFFVLLPDPLPPLVDLRKLRAHYPRLVYIAHPGAAREDELPPWVLPLPRLDDATVEHHYGHYLSAGGEL